MAAKRRPAPRRRNPTAAQHASAVAACDAALRRRDLSPLDRAYLSGMRDAHAAGSRGDVVNPAGRVKVKANPAGGCRDKGGRFIPVPGCRGPVSNDPPVKLKIGEKTYTLKKVGPPGVPKAVTDAAAKILRAEYSSVVVRRFPLGVGVYVHGRK